MSDAIKPNRGSAWLRAWAKGFEAMAAALEPPAPNPVAESFDREKLRADTDELCAVCCAPRGSKSLGICHSCYRNGWGWDEETRTVIPPSGAWKAQP